jgi:hypothetical protein
MSSICEAILDTLVKTKDIRESLIDPALRWDKTLVTDDSNACFITSGSVLCNSNPSSVISV